MAGPGEIEKTLVFGIEDESLSAPYRLELLREPIKVIDHKTQSSGHSTTGMLMIPLR